MIQSPCCLKGHRMENLQQTRDTGWRCDGYLYPQGCLGGCNDFDQTFGWNRWRCEICDHDLCDECVAEYSMGGQIQNVGCMCLVFNALEKG